MQRNYGATKNDPCDRIPNIPEDFYTYAGEIPWCETFQSKLLSELELISGTKMERIPVKKVAKLKDGTLLSEYELLARLLIRISREKEQSFDSAEVFEKMLESKEYGVSGYYNGRRARNY